MSNTIYLQQNCKNTIKSIRNNNKNIDLKLTFGHNNIVKGYWYQVPNNKLRSFTPLLQRVNK
jgi:hypothetical protein